MITEIKLFATLLVAIMALAIFPTAFADDSAASADTQPVMVAVVTPSADNHPLSYNAAAHNQRFRCSVVATLDKCVRRALPRLSKMTVEQFYDKNPVWADLKNTLGPGRTLLGGNI